LFRIERQSPSQAWTTNNNISFHTDMGLQPNTLYSYRVCAIYPDESTECSDWVPVRTMAAEIPQPPANRTSPTLTAHEVTHNSITVKWTGQQYDRVHIRWRKNTPGSSPLEAQIDIDHDERVGYRNFPGLEMSTPYTFRIQGCHVNVFEVANCGPWSEVPLQISTSGPPHEVWVDFASQGPHEGDASHPFKTIAEAVAVVTNGGTVKIMPGSSSERHITSNNKRVTLVAPNGGVTIGAR